MFRIEMLDSFFDLSVCWRGDVDPIGGSNFRHGFVFAKPYAKTKEFWGYRHTTSLYLPMCTRDYNVSSDLWILSHQPDEIVALICVTHSNETKQNFFPFNLVSFNNEHQISLYYIDWYAEMRILTYLYEEN